MNKHNKEILKDIISVHTGIPSWPAAEALSYIPEQQGTCQGNLSPSSKSDFQLDIKSKIYFS